MLGDPETTPSRVVVSAASDEPMVKLDGMPNAGDKLFDFVQ
jgi:hypothetical protein